MDRANFIDNRYVFAVGSELVPDPIIFSSRLHAEKYKNSRFVSLNFEKIYNDKSEKPEVINKIFHHRTIR